MKKLGLVLSLFLLVACGSKGGAVACKDAVDAAYATVLEENQVAVMEMDKETVTFYFSLDDAIVKDAYGIGPMMSAHVDMIAAVEATSEANAALIKDMMETYQTNLENDHFQYPANLAAISEAEIFTVGNNVYYVRLNTFTSDELTDEQKAEVIEEINDKAENAIKDLHK